MARKKTIDELRIEREKAEQDLKFRQENLKKLKQKEAELTPLFIVLSFRGGFSLPVFGFLLLYPNQGASLP